MAAFCAKCGAPLVEGAVFCGACGAQVVQAVAPAQPVVPPAAPSPWGQQPAPPAAVPPPSPWGQQAVPPAAAAPSPWGQQPAAAVAAAPAKSGGGTKVLLIVLGVLFLGAVLVVGGIVWEVHRVVNKVKTAAAEAGISSSDINSMGTITEIESCKYLSASDVSEAIGVTIVDVKSDASGCHYMAKGSADSYTAGHIAAMGGMTPPAETTTADSSSTETTSLVDISVQSGGGRAQVKVQKALMGGLGVNGSAHPDLSGIGDEALAIGNNLLIARKGDMFIQITYSNCPCALVQIKPLAKKLIDQL